MGRLGIVIRTLLLLLLLRSWVGGGFVLYCVRGSMLDHHGPPTNVESFLPNGPDRLQ
jgi:hypothetical protein